MRFSGHLVYVDQSLARPVPEFQRLVFNLALETGFQLAPFSTNVTYDQIIYYIHSGRNPTGAPSWPTMFFKTVITQEPYILLIRRSF